MDGQTICSLYKLAVALHASQKELNIYQISTTNILQLSSHNYCTQEHTYFVTYKNINSMAWLLCWKTTVEKHQQLYSNHSTPHNIEMHGWVSICTQWEESASALCILLGLFYVDIVTDRPSFDSPHYLEVILVKMTSNSVLLNKAP